MIIDALSLGWQTDLIFARFDGEVVDRGDHLVVRTPSNPTYWWGNFLLYRPSWRPGRFQYVCTDPSWRRRGLCTALVHAVCRHGFEVMKLGALVLQADPADVAIGIYESVGFVRGASTWQLELIESDETVD